MKKKDSYVPGSLTGHFEAPDGYRGIFGWLCGYSAEPLFLNQAAERFTRLIEDQRARQGDLVLALMLDPGRPQISPVDVPGVLHLGLKDPETSPFNLLHAKVALLAFRDDRNPGGWLLRLLVSTGNWTRESLERSLDLAWRLGLKSAELAGPRTEEVSQVCADMGAAWGMLKWLAGFFETKALFAEPPQGRRSNTALLAERFERVLEEVVNRTGRAKPRFFDNRNKSLLAQLPVMIRRTEDTGTRNYLAMGSGFYQAHGQPGKIPSVLDGIVKTLRKKTKGKPLLTKTAEIDLVVNPLNCQAVASSLEVLNDAGWRVYQAPKPDFFGNMADPSLHAKFIFSASYQRNSDWCNQAWLYLGSGNLTRTGFAKAMGPGEGNLEAGVVFWPGRLCWYPKDAKKASQVLTWRLPLEKRGKNVNLDDQTLEVGQPMSVSDPQYLAPPVAWLLGRRDEGRIILQSPDLDGIGFDVLVGSGQTCPKHGRGDFLWPDAAMPRQVEIRWKAGDEEHKAQIPVMNEFGGFSALGSRSIQLDEALWELEAFPEPPQPDLEEDGEEPPPAPVSDTDPATEPGLPGPASESVEAFLPIRRMMIFIETVARKQTAIPSEDWNLWCNRLEDVAKRTASSKEVAGFRDLGLNPLSPLYQPPFRPDFAATDQTLEGRLYEETLGRLEKDWKVEGLEPLGVKNES